MRWTRKKITAAVLAVAGLIGGGAAMYLDGAPAAHATHVQHSAMYLDGPNMYLD